MKASAKLKFIVAFSGGLDSTVLLHVCAVFFGPERILAVHVNHGLQAAAQQFEAQAKRTCSAWGIRLKIKRLKASPAKGESIEAWARSARYQVLAEVAKLHDIEHVFTAHHRDDQVETLMIALSRGAGLDGLRGIAANRPLDPGSAQSQIAQSQSMQCQSRQSQSRQSQSRQSQSTQSQSTQSQSTQSRSTQEHAELEASSQESSLAPSMAKPRSLVHRPLLECSRQALSSYAKDYELSWVEDPSNQDRKFLRNRIRLELMPALDKALPNFAQQASRSMEHLRQAAGRLEAHGAGLVRRSKNPSEQVDQNASNLALLRSDQGTANQIDRVPLLAMNDGDQAAALRAWLKSHQLSVPSQAKLHEIRKQLLKSKALKVSLFHDGKFLRREREILWIDERSQGVVNSKNGESRIDLRSRLGAGARSKSRKSSINGINGISGCSGSSGSSGEPGPDALRRLQKTPQGWMVALPEFKGWLSIQLKSTHRIGLLEPLAKEHQQTAVLQHRAILEAVEMQLRVLHVAAPRSTQKMQLEPNTPRKTLKNLFQAAGVPAALRKRLPCITRDEEVLYVAGLGTAQNSPWKFEFLPDL